ncbi:LysR family transcriptional regulator [Pseudomonas syringae group genomosp. 3]|uniref:LysR family transcriptional regulator n=1 Tax=Pseudomonas syringae pv. primulae TaxID=251707 RepID=A0A3M4SDC4_9PSED|nr:LysR family transcriptional regulator [Pseudomonas syringae group genomosp. 3]RMR12940.1 LysR family transcriptional regulator [Pseudomonas syringae pv. primulae]
MSLVQDRRILYFFEAVRLGSVRAAADCLNVAPSAVSRQIAQLEQELGSPLLERHRRGVKPTEAGDKVLAYYRQRLTQQEVLLDSIQALKGLHSGSVTLVSGEGFLESLAQPLARFSELYPRIELIVNVCGSNEVIRQVVEDEAHIGLVFNPAADPKIRSHAHQRKPVCVITAPDHPLAQEQNPIALQALEHYRVALPAVSYGIRQILLQAEHQLGITVQPTLTCSTFAMLKHFAVQGGVTLLPTFVVEEEIKAGKLRALPLQDEVFSSPQTHLISRLGRQLSVGANRLMGMLLQDMTAFRS